MILTLPPACFCNIFPFMLPFQVVRARFASVVCIVTSDALIVTLDPSIPCSGTVTNTYYIDVSFTFSAATGKRVLSWQHNGDVTDMLVTSRAHLACSLVATFLWSSNRGRSTVNIFVLLLLFFCLYCGCTDLLRVQMMCCICTDLPESR